MPRNMLIHYTLQQSLAHLKTQIKRYEKRQKESSDEHERRSWDDILAWLFDRGVNQMIMSKPGEVDQETMDFFLDRIPTRPDLRELRRRMDKDYQKWLKNKRI